MKIKFTKMQGCGNDYVYINGFVEKIPQEDKPDIVRKISDRHFGIGSDGAIFINPTDEADFEMEMYNADGTRSEMCGNGIRCVGKYVYDHHMTDHTEITVVSAGKIKYLSLTVTDGTVSQVCVNMGEPVLNASEVPVDLSKSGLSDAYAEWKDNGSKQAYPDAVIDQPIVVQNKKYNMTCVSMGNPHAVVFMTGVDELDINAVGPYFEDHPAFPKRTNTEFVEIIDDSHIKMRVYERGTGETLACGTGCCASVAACILNHKTKDEVSVSVLGGTILVKWDRDTNQIYMTGPAETVFEGEIDV